MIYMIEKRFIGCKELDISACMREMQILLTFMHLLVIVKTIFNIVHLML